MGHYRVAVSQRDRLNADSTRTQWQEALQCICMFIKVAPRNSWASILSTRGHTRKLTDKAAGLELNSPSGFQRILINAKHIDEPLEIYHTNFNRIFVTRLCTEITKPKAKLVSIAKFDLN